MSIFFQNNEGDVIFTNLHINDHIIYHTGIASGSGHLSWIKCTDCTFTNISISSTDSWIFDPDIDGISIYESIFINITTPTNILQTNGFINIHDSIFADIYGIDSIIRSVPFYYLPSVDIYGSKFENIATQIAIITTDYGDLDVTIEDSIFDIESGEIYHSQHSLEADIDIYNISVKAKGIDTVGATALFHFDSPDIVSIESMTVLYSYDMSEACVSQSIYSADDFNLGSVQTFSCQNPISMIKNYGNIDIDSVIIDIDILNSNASISAMDDTDHLQFNYGYGSSSSFISNYGIMSISNMKVSRTICQDFILNEAILTISNLQINQLPSNDDPNFLRSDTIILQSTFQSSLYVNNSYFYGSQYQIHGTRAEEIQIENTIFEMSTTTISIEYTQHFEINNCFISKTGTYFGKTDPSYYVDGNVPMFILWVDQALFVNNIISGFDPNGLLFAKYSNITFLNNTFSVNADNIYYNLSVDDLVFNDVYDEHYFYNTLQVGILYFHRTFSTALINNHFEANTIDPFTPFVSYRYTVDAPNCLSGNVFTDYAIRAQYADITSCTRPYLVDCIGLDSVKCFNEFYYFESPILDQIGYFIVSDNNNENLPIFTGDRADIVIDNVVIKTTDNLLLVDHHFASDLAMSVMFIDSYISGYDISYNPKDCKIRNNDRFVDDINYISKLSMDCNLYNKSIYESEFKQTMTSPTTQYINYSIPYKIHFTSKSSTYFPGELLQFEYQIMDRFNNMIPNNKSLSDDGISFQIELENNLFSSQVSIQSDGECPICDKGILINAISIEENINDNFTMIVSIDQETIIPQSTLITLNIIGCPIGYGPDFINFTCNPCGDGEYNLLPNNVDPCQSCDAHLNDGVECSDGNISIIHNHWMGFVDDVIISAYCASNYCCQHEGGCDYIHEEDKLCALNRDHTSKLCGKCKDGYSESMNSTKCVKCNASFSPFFLILPTTLSIILSFILILSNGDRQISKSPKNDKINETSIRRMLSVLLLRNTIYYEQAINQTLLNNPFSAFFGIFSSIFNSSFSINSYNVNEDDLWCFMEGLDAKNKILVDLFVPATMTLIICVLYLISKLLLKGPITIKRITVNFNRTFVGLYLMIIGKILDVIFRIISCTQIGDEWVHSYFGYEECYGLTYAIAISCLITIIISFAAIFIMMNPKKRTHRNHFSYLIVRPYKQEYYYWECILFFRRILIALFAVSLHDINFKLAFVAIMAFCAFLQHSYSPFLMEEANKMEYILINCFVIIIAAQLASSVNGIFLNITISLLIILPIPLILFYIYQFLRVKPNDAGKKNLKSYNFQIDAKVKNSAGSTKGRAVTLDPKDIKHKRNHLEISRGSHQTMTDVQVTEMNHIERVDRFGNLADSEANENSRNSSDFADPNEDTPELSDHITGATDEENYNNLDVTPIRMTVFNSNSIRSPSTFKGLNLSGDEGEDSEIP